MGFRAVWFEFAFSLTQSPRLGRGPKALIQGSLFGVHYLNPMTQTLNTQPKPQETERERERERERKKELRERERERERVTERNDINVQSR